MLSRLGAAVTESTRGIEGFRLDESSGALYHFVWDELCDWYIELVKLVFQTGTDAEKTETQRTLGHVLETTLRALHPFLPFITEELWQRLPRPASRPASIALAAYPTGSDGPESEQDEREMGVVMKVISAARTIRSEHELEKSARSRSTHLCAYRSTDAGAGASRPAASAACAVRQSLSAQGRVGARHCSRR